MKNLSISLFIILMSSLISAQDRISFSKYFIDQTMRVDYFHTGDSTQELYTLDKIYIQSCWSGSINKLIDSFGRGRYLLKIFDMGSNQLIYSKGFDCYFGEYQTTAEALAGKRHTYHESVLFPYPKNNIILTIEKRNKQNLFSPIFNIEINPEKNLIYDTPRSLARIIEIQKEGDSHYKVDLTFIAEGYTSKERKKAEKDMRKFSEILFTQEPFAKYKKMFNIYGVFLPSKETGCSEPQYGTMKDTALNSTFNSLGLERYLLTENNQTLQNITATVPHDVLVIMVNHKNYGGGGIYNSYLTFTSDNFWNQYLFLHELGHAFAGLADEYYVATVAYNEFYPLGIEPVEPNITSLLDPKKIKWQKLLSPKIPLPTPWEKNEFEKLEIQYQKERRGLNEEIAELKRQKAETNSIDILEKRLEELTIRHTQKINTILQNNRMFNMVGAFEGAGYSATKLFRPMVDCIMFSKGKKAYCRVCEKAIEEVIQFYTK